MKTLLSFLLLLFAVYSYGQSEKLFTVDRELSNSNINQIYQSKDGVIWIATEDGLNRYDGAKFSVYKHDEDNANSLVDNNVRTLFEDSKGNFLIGTERGLQRYDPASDRFSEIPIFYQTGENMNAHITMITERRNGQLLVATAGHGIYSLHLNEASHTIKEARLPISNFFITYLFEDNKENLWISTEGDGLYRINKSNQLFHYFSGKENAWNTVTCICQDKKGCIYISNKNKGMSIYDENKDIFQPVANLNDINLPINLLYNTKDGDIYIGTIGYGLKIYNTFTKEIRDSDFSFTTFNFSKSEVHAIMKDSTGNLWLGINAKGVMLLPATTNQFKYMGSKSLITNQIGSNSIKSIFKDKDDVLWLGTANDGIYGIKDNSQAVIHFEHKDKNHSVPSTVNSIHQTADGRIWLASLLEGLSEMNPKTGVCNYYELQDREFNDVKSISCLVTDTTKEKLWIGTMGGGLFYLDVKNNNITRCQSLKSGKEYQEEYNILPNRWIASLLYTRNGRLYIGTYDGLGCLDTKTMSFISVYGKNRLFKGNIIYTLFEDEKGDIWVGTTKGLIRLNEENGQSKTYTVHNGLPNNVICAIRSGGKNELWISTNYGISNFDTESENFINYYVGDGLQGNEFSKNAACIDSQGHIIFGGINGITYFHPADIKTEIKKPIVRIADFYINNLAVRKGTYSGSYNVIKSAVHEAKDFNLCYKDNSFSIEFSTMDFYNPERITYFYSLDGKIWTMLAPGMNRVSFSDLSPGTYRFGVKAKNYTSYSDINEIIIRIHPAWWASGWAWFGYIILLLAGISFILVQIRNRYRLHQEMLQHIHAEQINEAKLQFFINISHEIRTPMSLIISPLQQLLAMDKDRECRKRYTIIQRNAERILKLVNQLMDIRKIDKGQMSLRFAQTELVSFIRDLCDTFGQQQAAVKNIQLEFHSEIPETEIWIDTKNFDKVVLNLLSNACKFTPENGHIDIYISTGTANELSKDEPLHQFVQLIIKDSGIGIDPSEREHIFERFYQIRNSGNSSNMGTGIGLHLAHSLVELHHGTICVDDNGEGEPGCRFIIRLPQGCNHLRKETMDMERNSISEIKIEKVEANSYTDSTFIDDFDYKDMESKARARNRRHVLVVEDDEEIRNYICQELGDNFYMTQCTNGKEALKLILKRTPDLIISDIMMPEMDGITLCKRIRQNVIINHLPIILLTALTREEDNLEGLETGADAYLMKPFSIELLRKTAVNLIRNREQLRNTFSGRQGQEEKVNRPEIKSPDDKLMERIMRVINENLNNPSLTVEMISAEVGISRVHLHRKLKELTNQTTQQFIRNVRLKQAASLLAEKRHSIAEVASLTGFTHPTYFATAFRELFGVPPTEYMDQHVGRKVTGGTIFESEDFPPN